MKTRAHSLTLIAAHILSACLTLPSSAEAQEHLKSSASSKQHGCRDIRAKSVETVGDVATFVEVGVITNGGLLNGTYRIVFDPATGSVIVTDPDVVSWFSAFTLNTARGELSAHLVTLYNLVTGIWTAMARINPETSTGRFDGATGIIYFNGTTIGVFPDSSYPADVLAHICLADR